MKFEDALRKGFRAAMAERSYQTGTKINARTLGVQAKRSSAALYAWLSGRAGISPKTLGSWVTILGLSPPAYFEHCLAVAAPRTYRDPHPTNDKGWPRMGKMFRPVSLKPARRSSSPSSIWPRVVSPTRAALAAPSLLQKAIDDLDPAEVAVLAEIAALLRRRRGAQARAALPRAKRRAG